MTEKPEKDPALVKRGKAARVKGQVGEREVCEILTRIVGEKHTRLLGQARDSGGDVRYGPFLLEVKRQARTKMAEWQQQAAASARDAGMLPAVVWRQDGAKFWISVPFEEFVQIFEALRQGASDGERNGDGDPDSPAE